MTSLAPRTHISSQENQDRKVKSISRQPGHSGIPQKQFTEQTLRQRQPLGNLSNSKKATSKSAKDSVTLKPVHKSGLPTAKKTHRKTVSPAVEKFPDIESLPTLDERDAYPSPFVEPSYFKSLTASLKHTTVAPPPRTSLLDHPIRLSLQARPVEQLQGSFECEEPRLDEAELLDLPPLPDFDW